MSARSRWPADPPNSARSVMPAKTFTSTARNDGRAVIHSSTRITRAGLPRIWPGADVAEIQRLHAPRGEFVDQHHRQAGAGGDQADLALRIKLDIVEPLDQLAIGIGDRSAAAPRSARRCAAGVPTASKIHHQLRVTGDAAGGRDEQRIDLRQRQFAFDQQVGQPASDRGNMAAPPAGSPAISSASASTTACGMRRAKPPLRRAGLFDVDAALRPSRSRAARSSQHRP